MIDDAFVDRIAAAADVDKRSVIRHLAGLLVRGKPGARIERALADAKKKSREVTP